MSNPTPSSFIWQSFLLWVISSSSSAEPVETLLFNPSSLPEVTGFVFLARPLPMCCGSLSPVSSPAGWCLGFGYRSGVAQGLSVWRADCHQQASVFFHETILKLPGVSWRWRYHVAWSDWQGSDKALCCITHSSITKCDKQLAQTLRAAVKASWVKVLSPL